MQLLITLDYETGWSISPPPTQHLRLNTGSICRGFRFTNNFLNSGIVSGIIIDILKDIFMHYSPAKQINSSYNQKYIATLNKPENGYKT